MKAVTIKGIAMLTVDKFGVSLNYEDVGKIIRTALKPTEEETEKHTTIPAQIFINIEPLSTELQVEHPGEPKLMNSIDLEMRKVS